MRKTEACEKWGKVAGMACAKVLGQRESHVRRIEGRQCYLENIEQMGHC